MSIVDVSKLSHEEFNQLAAQIDAIRRERTRTIEVSFKIEHSVSRVSCMDMDLDAVADFIQDVISDALEFTPCERIFDIRVEECDIAK
jgi:hypothetical protein